MNANFICFIYGGKKYMLKILFILLILVLILFMMIIIYLFTFIIINIFPHIINNRVDYPTSKTKETLICSKV